MFFDVFLFILAPILCATFSPGSEEGHIGWGGNLNGRLGVSCVRNICIKNYYNPIILQVTINNVGIFLEHSVYSAMCRKRIRCAY